MVDPNSEACHANYVEYRVDRRNVIVGVGGGWVDFARDNDASNLSPASVIGVPLNRFINGDSTWMFVEVLLRSVRVLQRTLVRPYRCDSPTHRRYMEMTLEPQPSGEVTLRHRIVREEPLTRPLNFRSVGPGVSPLIRCSMCNRLKGPQGWVEPDQAVFLKEAVETLVVHGVCPECLASLDRFRPRRER